ncbi:MAG: polysaccharide deacetylase family protein [Pseudomonadales bacterium]
MKFISDHFESYWASEAELILSNESASLSKKPPIILTFDDGLLNNKVTAAPILEKYNLKATFFVCSALMDGKSMLWNHELRCRLSLLSPEEVYKVSNSKCLDNSSTSVFNFVESVKLWPEHEVKHLMSLLRDKCPEPQYSAQMLRDYLIMSTEDLKNLPDCVEVGSHTISHPILDSLDEEEMENQIVGSKAELARILSRNVDVFCYPNGVTNTFCNDLVSKNYKVAVTTNEGFASLTDGLNLLKRIPSANNLRDLVWRFLRPEA